MEESHQIDVINSKNVMKPLGNVTNDETGNSSQCYVCLEDDVHPLLSGICGCTTSVIHTSCLEKMINSKNSREKSLEERTRCSVCGQQFTVIFAPYIIDASVISHTPFVEITSGICGIPYWYAVYVVWFLWILIIFVVPKNSLQMIVVSMAIIYLQLSIVSKIIAHRYAYSDGQHDDDNTFFNETLVQARKDIYHNHVTLEQAMTMSSDKVLLIITADETISATNGLHRGTQTDNIAEESKSIISTVEEGANSMSVTPYSGVVITRNTCCEMV